MANRRADTLSEPQPPCVIPRTLQRQEFGEAPDKDLADYQEPERAIPEVIVLTLHSRNKGRSATGG
jgi:hypothetical protein